MDCSCRNLQASGDSVCRMYLLFWVQAVCGVLPGPLAWSAVLLFDSLSAPAVCCPRWHTVRAGSREQGTPSAAGKASSGCVVVTASGQVAVCLEGKVLMVTTVWKLLHVKLVGE